MSSQKVITRFAPSPTGFLHAGNYRTALFCYILARQNNGSFFVRIEDTDKARSKKEYAENILETLAWMGLSYDGEVVYQSARTEKHKAYLKKLVDEGKAFVSKETPKEPGGRTEVIRFKNPNKKVTFHDLIRGDITFDTTELGDFIIAKSFDEPVFHLAVVADDFDMGITHVIRGEDHISNTPRHILIQEALGAPTPIYSHVPLVLSPDRSKLSKRKGALPLTAYRDQGYLPEAVINFLALVGWNPGTEQELFTLEELIKEFKMERINKAGAIFNEEKLQWINKEYIKKIPASEQTALLTKWAPKLTSLDATTLSKLAPIVFERISTLSEITQMSESSEFDYLLNAPSYMPEALLWKGKSTKDESANHLSKAIELLSGLSENTFDRTIVKETVWAYAEGVGRGQLLWPMRYSLSGREKSPDPFILAELLGKKETLNRLTYARDILLKK
ncbi:glutamate--tRNA ligase [Patescibacteria group bacterium]|nr:MAG: glutamate--tRNA ligase [Patescibacteria group bacterium]